MSMSPHWFRQVSGSRLAVSLLVLTLSASILPAGAQSPVAQPDIKLVQLFEQTCPSGFDPSAGTIQDATQMCPQSLPGITFTLTSQEPSFPNQTHPTNGSSDTEWHHVPSGVPYTIQQTVPQGYGDPVVRCQFFMALDPSMVDTERTFTAAGGLLSIGTTEPTLDDYRQVACYWFDIPRGPSGVNTDAAAPQSQVAQAEQDQPASGATPGALAAPATGARLDIRTWACPFHYDFAAATVDQLFARCSAELPAAQYTLNGNPSTLWTLGTHVSYGTLTIQQEPIDIWDAGRVFCYTLPETASHGPLQASQEIPFTTNPDDTFTVTLTVDPGEAVDCIWFDATVTESTKSTVLLHKYICPDGFVTGNGGLNELLTGCSTPQGNAYFEIRTSLLQGGLTNGAGDRTFLDVSPGPFTVTATQPLGFVTKRVLCRSYNADDWDHITESYADVPITFPNTISGTLQPHWETECSWFVSSGVDHGYLDIVAMSCPLSFAPTPTTPRTTFAQQCTVGLDGVPFDIASGINFRANAPSVAGTAFSQAPVPAGTLDITGHEPGSGTYRFLRAFCGSAPFVGIGAIPTSWTSFSSILTTWNVGVNDQVVCEFYYQPIAIAAGASTSPPSAAPTETGDEVATNPSISTTPGGTVTVTLYVCPGSVANIQECVAGTGPTTVHFEPAPGQGSAFDLEIDASGTGQTAADGVYRLAGFPPSTCLIESDAFGATGQLVVDEGSAIEVRIYTCDGT